MDVGYTFSVSATHSDSGDLMEAQSTDNATPPMDMKPHVEISRADAPTPFSLAQFDEPLSSASQLASGEAVSHQHMNQYCPGSPQSADFNSNAPTSSHPLTFVRHSFETEVESITPSISLIPIKQEPCTDDGPCITGAVSLSTVQSAELNWVSSNNIPFQSASSSSFTSITKNSKTCNQMNRRKSELWNHFTILSTDKKKARCAYCRTIISISSGSTGNLTRHLKTKHVSVSIHSKETQELIEEPQLPPGATIRAPTTANSHPCVPRLIQNTNRSIIPNYMNRPVPLLRSKQFDHQLVKMIVKEYHPFGIVEDPEFKKFVGMLCPGYTLPSRQHISTKLIPQLYQLILHKVKTQVREAPAVCLTTDSWTSINNESFVAITSHFLNSQCKLTSVLLGCVSLPSRHTPESFANCLQDTVKQWGIEKKVVAVISDNAANITAAVKLCHWRHFACFVHSVNRIVQAGLQTSGVQDVLNKVKSIVEFFKGSSHNLEKLHSVREQMGLPKLKLKQDIPTQWHTTYEMLQRITKIKNAVVSTLTLLQTDTQTLTPIEWKVVEKIISVLEIFEQVTVEVSTRNDVSLSKVILFVSLMNSHLTAFASDEDIPPAVDIMIRSFKEGISEHLRDIEEHELTSQSTLLDPRFKKYGFSDDTKYDTACCSLRLEACSIKIEHSAPLLAHLPQPSTSTGASSPALWEKFDNAVKNVTITSSFITTGVIELDQYLQEPLLNRKEDPLTWWKERRHIYPRLYELVKKQLCVMATCVPCEHIFSKAGQVLSEKRRRLSSSKLSEIVFLNYNL